MKTCARAFCVVCVLCVLAAVCVAAGDERDSRSGEPGADAPKIFVPYKDLSAVVDPAGKSVLMGRKAFAALLAAARKRGAAAEGIELGQVVSARYAAEVRGENVSITGDLTVRSLSDKPVRVPFAFSGVGLSSVTLDGKAAPLGYDEKGGLVLVVSSKGTHKVAVTASAVLKELPKGGMALSVSLPPASAGTMKLISPGDLEVHADAPVSSRTYDKKADRTTVEMTVGGRESLSIALSGNGRADERSAIMLGESATAVTLRESFQVLRCAYTVRILRRGVRELNFTLPTEWTVTDVSSADMVKWSVHRPDGKGPQQIVVQMRSPVRGEQVFRISATGPSRGAGTWRSPNVSLVGAAFQRGYLMVDTGKDLRTRAEKLADARREGAAVTASTANLMAMPGGRLYYHWGGRWSVQLDLATSPLRRTSTERQKITVAAEQVTLDGKFQITAVGREMFDASFVLPPSGSGWDVRAVTVNRGDKGFEYRTSDSAGGRTLRIELARPVKPEATADVAISLRRVPEGWDFSAQADRAAERRISVPLIRTSAAKVSGVVWVVSGGDLDTTTREAPKGFKPVTVGRMALLDLPGEAQCAYEYTSPARGRIALGVTRRRPRLAARAVGLITARTTKLLGQWRITYTISRARGRRLYLLADKSLGRHVKIDAPGRRIASTRIVAPGGDTVDLSKALAGACNLWQVTLDGKVTGEVRLDVRYAQPMPKGRFDAPLVRPIGVSQSDEVLAVQGGEELAISVHARGASGIDAADLPPLPAPAKRIIGAFRLEAPTTPGGAASAIALETTVHGRYAVPPALALSADLTTYLDARGAQRTEAQLRIVNAGMQFLTVRLPDGAELWSVSVAGRQTRPRRNSAGDYLIPLARSQPATATNSGQRTSTGEQTARVIYALPADADAGGRVVLGGLTLPGLKINQVRWAVHPPPGCRIVSQETHMQSAGLARPTPAYAKLFGALGEVLGTARAMSKLGESARPAYDAAPLVAPPDHLETEKMGDKKAKLPSRATASAAEQLAAGVSAVKVRGRYTLPVELVATRGAGPMVRFASLGESELVVHVRSDSSAGRWWSLGAVLVAAASVVLVKSCRRRKLTLIVVVLLAASLAAVWLPATTHFANGAFTAAACLIPFYLAVFAAGLLVRKLRAGKGAPGVGAATVCALIAAMFLAVAPARAERQAQPRTPGRVKATPIVIPYEGDPTKADRADKVLVPYERFVRLWNLAHPDDPLEAPAAGAGVSIAGARYDAVVGDKQMTVTLSARIRTFGRERSAIAMPFKGLAVTEARFAGKPAALQVGPKGKRMALHLPGGVSGDLRITAVGTPKRLGRTGNIALVLPPLPGAVMTVRLPAEDLLLEAPGAKGVLTSRKVSGGAEWTVPLGRAKELSLRWSPRAVGGSADRTLSAVAQHDVYFNHWGVRGAGVLSLKFSGGERDRFGVLVPAGVKVTGLSGANVRDFRDVGERTVEGLAFRLVEVRLHRPAKKKHKLTLRWVGTLPAMGSRAVAADDRSRGASPVRLLLPRAAGVGRESGTVTLHAADGMTVKVAKVSGGRRAVVAANAPAFRHAGATTTVGRYYWPYRPFSLSVRLDRPAVEARAKVDQLVRISAERIQLLVHAKLRAKRGRLFGCRFALPDDYELLSVVGPAVGDWYVQPATATARRMLHVAFRHGTAATNVVLALVRDDPKLGELAVPTVTLLDSAGLRAKQTGRLAVQVAPALDAQTLSSDSLKPIAPSATRGWLDARQVGAVRFAYSYEKSAAALRLKVRRRPTSIRVENFVALTVQPTSAWCTYRLRYTIAGSPVDRVSFTLPSAYAPLVAVRSPAMRNVTTADAGSGRTRWTVSLTRQVTGVLDVAVNFALPINADTKHLEIPLLETGAPAGRRTIIAVQNDSRHELAVKDSKNLAALPLSEQKKLLSAQVRKSLQYVFQSFAEDWALDLKLTAAKPARRIRAVVDLMAITTVVGRSGRCRYEVNLTLQNRSEQFLRVVVPESLKLWSAVVAGRPARPVTAADAPTGEVLIPLAKTSPGGLPYDVRLYLAGEALPRLERITKLSPPGIAIAGIPVMRTTWSLRLPGGYRYVRPGGNVSPVAGEAETRIVALEARLEQLGRFASSYEETDVVSVRQGRTTRRNWDTFNEQIAGEISETRRFIKTERGKLTKSEYSRLKGKLDEQSAGQQAMQDQWKKQQDIREARQGGNVNWFLNADAAGNPGLAESARNKTLNIIPGFVESADREQRLEITKSLKRLDKDERKLGYKHARIDTLRRQRAELADQAEKLKDNRMQRYYQRAGRQTIPQGKRDGPNAPPAKPASRQPALWDSVLIEAPAEGLPAGDADGGIHVAGGTFSLPVELPEGEVRLDFARPGGGAEVTVWAVRNQTVSNLYATGAVVAAAVILWLVLKLLAQIRLTGVRVPPVFIVAYVVLAAALLLVVGLEGLIPAVVIVLASELLRRKLLAA